MLYVNDTSIKTHSYVGYTTDPQRHRRLTVRQLPERWPGCRATEGKLVVTGDILTVGGGHATHRADHVSQRCARETYMALLPSVAPVSVSLKTPISTK